MVSFQVPPINVAAGGAAAGQTIGNLFNDFQTGRQAADENRVRKARQSLADLGTTPGGGFDYNAGASRLFAAGDIQGAQTLATLGMNEQERKLQQERYAADQNYRADTLKLRQMEVAQRAPDTTTIYDPETGRAQTGMWNPGARTYEPIGGTKAPPAATTAPRTTTIYDPETGQPQTAQWDASKNDWVPLGGAKKPAPRQVPASVQKAETDDLADVQSIGQVNQMLGTFKSQIDSGGLQLGPLENLQSRAQNWLGNSSPNSRNYASFTAGLEKLRNESLRLNKGVQTEGDAQRAWNELFANINDPKVVSQRLTEIQKYNEDAARYRVNQIQLRRQTNGLDPVDVSGVVTAPIGGKDGSRVQPGGSLPSMGAAGAQTSPDPVGGGLREGATAVNPQTGERIIYRNGQWGPM